MTDGIIHTIFDQYYKNTVLFPLDYENLKELEAELIADIAESADSQVSVLGFKRTLIGEQAK